MTIKQTLAQLRAIGCKAKWMPDWQEYRVTIPSATPEIEESLAYYTDDAEDALATGKHMKRLAEGKSVPVGFDPFNI